MLRERNELTCRALESVEGARFDVIDPAMQLQVTLRKRLRDRGMSLEVVELSDHVLAHPRVDTLAIRGRLARLADELRRIGIAQPTRDSGHMVEDLPVATSVIAPQSEWPHTTIAVTPSAAAAYSTVADTPPGSGRLRFDNHQRGFPVGPHES
jgi:hypothetical protein